MNPEFASPCQCANCPGSTCGCGCQRTAMPNLHASGGACACASRCGCDAAESGCACAAPAKAA